MHTLPLFELGAIVEASYEHSRKAAELLDDDPGMPKLTALEMAIEAIEAYDSDIDPPSKLTAIVERLRATFGDLETDHDHEDAVSEAHDQIGESREYLAMAADQIDESEREYFAAMAGPRRGIEEADPGWTMTARGLVRVDPARDRVECERAQWQAGGIDPATGLPPRPQTRGEVFDRLDALSSAACDYCRRANLRANGYPVFGGPDGHDRGCPKTPAPSARKHVHNPCTLCRTGGGKRHGRGCTGARARAS